MLEFVGKVLGINKLVEYGVSGLGAITGPLMANWKADREGRARLTAARYDAEVQKLEAGSTAKSVEIIAAELVEARNKMDIAAESGTGRLEISRGDIALSMEFQGRKQLANSSAVMEGAADTLGDRLVDDHEPDHDWTARFFDCVKDVSDEDMQRLWARILAGEVESPGKTSLRTLETLRNMSKSDAEMFKGICDFVLGEDFLFYDNEYVQQYEPLDYETLLHLQDCGLVNVGPNLVKTSRWSGSKETLVEYGTKTIVITGAPESKDILEIPVILLTGAGKELFGIVVPNAHMDYLRSLATFLKSKDFRLDHLEGVTILPSGRIQFTNRMPIEPNTD